MFDKVRYATSGLQAAIPETLQQILWNMIDTMNVEKKDYLQVFKLDVLIISNSLSLQKIIHSQELPEYKKISFIKCICPIKTTIFVIDNETHSTMLLASEY